MGRAFLYTIRRPRLSRGRRGSLLQLKGLFVGGDDGVHGGGAVLTPEAVRLVDAYEAYTADVTAYAQARFEEAFGFFASDSTPES